MITDHQVKQLKTSTVSVEVLNKNGLDDDFYIKPLLFLENLGINLDVIAWEYKHAVEMANDEDICPAPAHRDMSVIVDGILAFLFADKLEECGMNLLTYFTYRFTPPSPEFQKRLDKFESLIKGEDC